MKKIEYLITIKNAGTFCNNKKLFIGFLNSDDQIKVTNKIISYQKHEIKYNLVEKKNKNSINFELTLFFNDKFDDGIVLGLTKLLRANIIKIKQGDTHIKILWDDLSREYSIEAYPIINKIENLMRLLISKFMILNVGIDWFSTQIHEDVKKKRKSDDKNNNVGLLYDDVFNLDFIDLADVLFKPYRTMKIEEIDSIIEKHTQQEKISISQIADIYPRSNWDRHFKNIVDKSINDNFIKKRWEKLYDIRNSIAHNRLIGKHELEDLKTLFTELTPVIEKAITALDDIKLTEQEKELTKSFPKESLGENIFYHNFFTFNNEKDKDENQCIHKKNFQEKLFHEYILLLCKNYLDGHSTEDDK